MPSSSSWSVFGTSVRGARHLRTGQPNQDAVAYEQTGGVTLVCVADGHGGSEFFRSDVGASLAAKAALSVLRDSIEGDVAKRIVNAWGEAVDAHLTAAPYDGDSPRSPRVPYGCTLLAIAATPKEVHLWQLGDGDILCTDAAGDTHRPLPPDPRLMGNQTTSLCMPEAEKEFRSAVVPINAGGPALIAISTDGYANSFETDADFLQIGGDYLQMLRASGPKEVAAQCAPILEDTSRNGSGDDITLALLYRGDVVAIPASTAGKPTVDKLRQFGSRLSRTFWIVTLLLAVAQILKAPAAPL